MADRLAPSERHKFISNGQLVYEWDQTLSDVNVYVSVPPGTRAQHLYCTIEPNHLKIGLQSNPPYLSETLCDHVVVSESLWTLGTFSYFVWYGCVPNVEDGVMNISLHKARTGETWGGAFQRHVLDANIVEEDKKRLLLERFQSEHTGFDFSGAEVSGCAPNPRTFLKDK